MSTYQTHHHIIVLLLQKKKKKSYHCRFSYTDSQVRRHQIKVVREGQYSRGRLDRPHCATAMWQSRTEAAVRWRRHALRLAHCRLFVASHCRCRRLRCHSKSDLIDEELTLDRGRPFEQPPSKGQRRFLFSIISSDSLSNFRYRERERSKGPEERQREREIERAKGEAEKEIERARGEAEIDRYIDR